MSSAQFIRTNEQLKADKKQTARDRDSRTLETEEQCQQQAWKRQRPSTPLRRLQ